MATSFTSEQESFIRKIDTVIGNMEEKRDYMEFIVINLQIADVMLV